MNAQVIKDWQAKHGVTNEELAARLEIDMSTLWRNIHRSTTKRFVLALSAVTGLPVERLEVSEKKLKRA